MISGIRLLVLDAYGTLISTGTGSLDAVRRIAQGQAGFPPPEIFYREWKKVHRYHMDQANKDKFLSEEVIFRKDLAVLYHRYGIARNVSEDVQYMLDSLTGRKAYPETCEAVSRLRERFRVVIGSTTDTIPLEINMRDNGIFTDAVYTSESIGKYKPDPYFYTHILCAEGVKPENSVFIGDSVTDDIEGPQAVGMHTVLVDRKGIYNAANSVQPDHTVNSLTEISGLIE